MFSLEERKSGVSKGVFGREKPAFVLSIELRFLYSRFLDA